jgi:phosphoribosyl-dephospho-CoA transferase
MPQKSHPVLLERHAFVQVEVPAWSALIASRPDLAAEPLVVDWVKRGFPLIVRRSAGDDGRQVDLGLPLPPSHDKRRIAVTLPCNAITGTTRPPLLVDAEHIAPAHWRPYIARLAGLATDVRCFGSLAWQYRTGLPYMTERSDVDLLWPLPAADAVEGLLAGIAAIAAEAPMGIDGEIVTATGGVNWRELYGRAVDEVLVKGLRDVGVMPRAVFLAGAAL